MPSHRWWDTVQFPGFDGLWGLAPGSANAKVDYEIAETMNSSLRHLRCHQLWVTALGLVLAMQAGNSSAQGWDCVADASGEWLCQAALPGAATGAEVAGGVSGEGEAVVDPGTGAFLPPVGGMAKAKERHRLTRLSDDWVPLEKLTAQQKASPDALPCCGAYVDPQLMADQTDPENAQIQAHADQTATDLVNETTTLTGDVQIRQGYRYVRADQAVVKKNPRQVTLDGNVELREPGLLLLSEDANLMLDDKTAQMNNVQYLLHEKHAHGDAETLVRSETGVIAMANAAYSYCPVNDRQWHLKARSLTLDPNDSQGRARHVTLRVGKVPVFYTPYLQFPLGNQRTSGFLAPSFGMGENGFQLQTPYYFNLAPNYDLTLTPRYMSKRGLMLNSAFRHMSEHTTTSLYASALPGDGQAKSGEQSDRWYLGAKHSGTAKRWESLVDYGAVSDDDYFHDFGSSGLRASSRSQLRQEGRFDYLPDNWRIGVQAKKYQTLSDSLADPHDVLPSLYADGNYALNNGLVFDLHHSATAFGHKDDGDLLKNDDIDMFYDIEQTERRILTGQRYNMDYSMAYPIRTSSAFLTPKIGVRHVTQQLNGTGRSYLLDDDLEVDGEVLQRGGTVYAGSTPDGTVSTSAAVASLDSGLIFERDTQWFGNSYRQTLEPRLFYYYSSAPSQEDTYNFDSNSLTFSYPQLFRDYRFAGEDYLDDANQLSAGITTRYLDPKSGRELLRASVGQAYYLDKREVVLEPTKQDTEYEQDRSHSALVAEVAARINRFWDARVEHLWNDDKSSRERQTVDVRYRDEQRRLFNIGYQFVGRTQTEDDHGHLVNRDVEQTYVSAAYPIGRQWSLIGHWNHDITNSRQLETIAGVEYDSCCWSTRVIMRQWAVNRHFEDDVDANDMNNGVFFQVYFKGLGSAGEDVEGMVSDAIMGFEDRGKALD